jgi:hypothetical protein
MMEKHFPRTAHRKLIFWVNRSRSNSENGRINSYKLCVKGLWKKKFIFKIWGGGGHGKKGFSHITVKGVV